MADDRFRRQLAQVLDQWVAEELIEPSHQEKLRQYYRLDQLASSAGGRFSQIILLLGAVLVGLGLISFVAANWDYIPPGVRAVASLLCVMGFQGWGFYLWRRNGSRLGNALLILGELAMGGSIGLMAQWFQVSGPPSGLFLAWGLAVLVVAYSLRHTPSGILALWLLLAAYTSDYSLWWSHSFQPAFIPWGIVVLLMPLAYWCRSRWIWFQILLLLILGLHTLAAEIANKDYWYIWFDFSYPFSMAHLVGISGVWAWSLHHQRGLPWLRRHLRLGRETQQEEFIDADKGLDFSPTSQFMALFGSLVMLYAWSFWGRWSVERYESGRFLVDYWQSPILNFSRGPALITLALLALGVAALWIGNLRYLVQHWQGSDPQQRRLMISNGWIGLGLVTLMALLQVGGLWGMAVIMVNFALCAVGGSLLWQGLQLGQRWRFWLGLLTLTLEVMTRFFEYDTGLLLKSLALVTCGVGVILAGLKFERMLTSLPPASSPR